jgi:hypothetical protein
VSLRLSAKFGRIEYDESWSVGHSYRKNLSAGTHQAYVVVTWTFPQSTFTRNIYEYRLRYAEAELDGWTVRREANVRLATVPPTANTFTIAPTRQDESVNYTFQICVLYENCPQSIDWSEQMIYPVNLIDPLHDARTLALRNRCTATCTSTFVLIFFVFVFSFLFDI